MERRAFCCCGQLQIICHGEPVRISLCHCFACQRRTGSAFGFQARFHHSQTSTRGEAAQFRRVGDSGGSVTFNFCPVCGSTVFWHLSSAPDLVAVAVGAFADPQFPAPRFSVYEGRRHHWISLPAGQDIEHSA
jgi:hypothetical protein